MRITSPSHSKNPKREIDFILYRACGPGSRPRASTSSTSRSYRTTVRCSSTLRWGMIGVHRSGCLRVLRVVLVASFACARQVAPLSSLNPESPRAEGPNRPLRASMGIHAQLGGLERPAGRTAGVAELRRRVGLKGTACRRPGPRCEPCSAWRARTSQATMRPELLRAVLGAHDGGGRGAHARPFQQARFEDNSFAASAPGRGGRSCMLPRDLGLEHGLGFTPALLRARQRERTCPSTTDGGTSSR